MSGAIIQFHGGLDSVSVFYLLYIMYGLAHESAIASLSLDSRALHSFRSAPSMPHCPPTDDRNDGKVYMQSGWHSEQQLNRVCRGNFAPPYVAPSVLLYRRVPVA